MAASGQGKGGNGASRRSDVASFIAMDVLARANALEQAGRDICHLELGQPGAPAPALVRDVAARALGEDRLGYTDALGRPSLRKRIARHYGEAYGIDLDPARVIVTTGSSGGFTLAFLSMFDAGQRIAIAEPGYPAYRNIVKALGLEPVGIEVGPRERWQVTPAQIAALAGEESVDGLLVASPANPTGTMLDAGALASLAGACEGAGIRFISDEIYHGLTYGADAATALGASDQAIVVNSFSKYYCMTGWRIGWMVVPADLVRVVERLAQNIYISAPTLSQIAAEAAFDAREELDLVRDGYAANRDLLASALERAGLDRFAPPDGAFYLYADVSRLTNDSTEFANAMLAEAGVATTPGVDFDPERGASFLRLSYAGERDRIEEAARRITRWIDGR